ncbi:YihY/virulence factor BrkB family protein [Virgibacillus sp. MG-45]|uniref:YihY/virulence factor BrkB family protein n=1 Tax=Virgibacillus sp. MG-45 TaxID=3102791 RepID=UPI002EDAF500
MTAIIHFTSAFLSRWKQHNIPLLAAAQAYHYLLSIIPLLIVCFTIIPYFQIQPEDAIAFVQQHVPDGIATIFQDNIVHIVQTPKGGLLTIGIIGALWTASNGVRSFMQSINEAYDIEETRSFLAVRLRALGLTIGVILAFLIAFIIPVLGNLIWSLLKTSLPIFTEFDVLFQVLRWFVSFLVLALFIMGLYRFAPNKKLSFQHIFPGACIASLLWQIISFGFSFYVSNFGNYSVTYGSLGGIIILMIWFYLTAMLLLIGALINVLLHDQKHKQTKQGEKKYA